MNTREPVKYITNEIWENRIGRGYFDTEKQSFWRRNNLDLFPVELIPEVTGNYMQIIGTLDSLKDAYIRNGIIELRNNNYKYDEHNRLIYIYDDYHTYHRTFNTKIEYTSTGKIVSMLNSTAAGETGHKKYYQYIGNKEIVLDCTINSKVRIKSDLPIQIVFINGIIRSSRIGSKLYTLYNEYGHCIEEVKPTRIIKTENFYDEMNNRIQYTNFDCTTGRKDVRTLEYDEHGNVVWNSFLPNRRYHFEYYRNSLGRKTLNRIRNEHADVVLSFPKF